jgi:hypothetical protein
MTTYLTMLSAPAKSLDGREALGEIFHDVLSVGLAEIVVTAVVASTCLAKQRPRLNGAASHAPTHGRTST